MYEKNINERKRQKKSVIEDKMNETKKEIKIKNKTGRNQ